MPYHFTDSKGFILCQTDLSGHIQLFDEQLPDLLKTSARDLRGRHVLDITRPDFRTTTQLMFSNLLRTGAGYTIEKVFCDELHESIPALVHVCLLRDEQSRPQGVVAIIQPRCRWSQ